MTSSSTRPSTSAASAKRPCGLVTCDRRGRRTGPAGRAPGGAACDPPASVRSRPALPTRARGSAAAANVPVGSTTMAWAWPKPESNAGAASTSWPASASPRAPRRSGAWPSTTTVGGPPLVHVSNPVARPRSAQRGARRRRRRRDCRAANRRAATCSRICGWASPPIVPNTAASAPSRVAIAGHSVCGGRRPGASSAGWPGCRQKPRPRLCRLIPVVGSTSHEPKPDALDWIRLTARPAASAVHRYVVSPAAAATGRRPARSTSTARPRSSMAASRAAPSAASWSTSGRSKPAVAAASTSRWAHAASSGSSGSPTRRRARAAPSEQVALRVRADRATARPRRRRPAAARPSRPARWRGRPRVNQPSPSASSPSPNAPP